MFPFKSDKRVSDSSGISVDFNNNGGNYTGTVSLCNCTCHYAFTGNSGCNYCWQNHQQFTFYSPQQYTTDPLLLQLIVEIKTLIQDIKNIIDEKRRDTKSRKSGRSKSS